MGHLVSECLLRTEMISLRRSSVADIVCETSALAAWQWSSLLTRALVTASLLLPLSPISGQAEVATRACGYSDTICVRLVRYCSSCEAALEELRFLNTLLKTCHTLWGSSAP